MKNYNKYIILYAKSLQYVSILFTLFLLYVHIFNSPLKEYMLHLSFFMIINYTVLGTICVCIV